MRVAVSEQGYSSAVESLVGGNELAARTATRLAGRLRACAGMAGDDSTASEFAASYDAAATATIAALESTVGALGVLGRLVEASLANHAHADARSTLPGWAHAAAGPPTVADRAVGVRLAPPPSSLGAHDDGPSGPAGLVLDVLQDVFWPNADTSRLRSAARSWAAAATHVGLLTAHCDSALAALEGERSPEIPVAVGVLRDVRTRVGDLAAQLQALGSACSEYAEHVDAKRDELRSLLEDLAWELGATAAVGSALSFVSGGLAAGAAGSAGAARIAAAGSRARGILDSLRVLAGGTAVTVRPVAVTAGEIGARTEQINSARVMLTEAGGRTSGLAHEAGLWRPGWLRVHEIKNSHTLSEHVSRSNAQLLERLAKRRIPYASTFTDQRTAERLIARTIDRQAGAVDRWLRTGTPRIKLVDKLATATGRSAGRDGVVSDVTGIRVVLERDPSMSEGFRVLTAFPQP